MLQLGCLFQLFFAGAYCLLLVRFVLMIFYPGTPETTWLFQGIQPTFSLLESFTTQLMFPITYLSQWLTPHLPQNLQAWFPTAQAATVMQLFAKLILAIPTIQQTPVGQNLLHVNYQQRYPGRLEWIALLSIPLWSAFQGSLQGLGGMLTRLMEAQNTPQTAAHMQVSTWQQTDTGYTRLAHTEERRQVDPDLGIKEMLSGLKQENINLQVQKQELRSTFSQYVSPNVLRYIEQNRGALEALVNQKQQVTVLFCDIRGFTAFSQNHTPEEVAAYLAEYFSLANDIILNQYEGTISKLMGDGIMAYWGFPVPNEQHALTATQAAISIVKAMDQRNLDTSKPPIHVGVGLCSGDVVIGNVGSKDFMDFTLIGDPVNLASRLEGVNKRFDTRILIAESTYQGLHGRIRCQDRGHIEIRGWNGDLHIFEPLL